MVRNSNEKKKKGFRFPTNNRYNYFFKRMGVNKYRKRGYIP